MAIGAKNEVGPNLEKKSDFCSRIYSARWVAHSGLRAGGNLIAVVAILD
jgi:hypothetical protein